MKIINTYKKPYLSNNQTITKIRLLKIPWSFMEKLFPGKVKLHNGWKKLGFRLIPVLPMVFDGELLLKSSEDGFFPKRFGVQYLWLIRSG